MPSCTDPFCVTASSPRPSHLVPARRTLTEPFCVCARTSPPTSTRFTEPFVVRSSMRPVTPLTPSDPRSEEHTSELQSHSDLVCRLLLEKKKKRKHTTIHK